VYLLPDGRAAKGKEKAVGIVDPFLTVSVKEGQRFLLVVYPRKITSLRHVWSHPAFPEEHHPAFHKEEVASELEFTEAHRELADKVAKRLQGITPSQQWLKEYAERIDVSYDDLMEHTKEYVDHGYSWSDGGKFEGESLPDGFWEHYEKVTGTEVEDKTTSFFSCSC